MTVFNQESIDTVDIIEQYLSNFNTAMLGVVHKFDSASQTCSVKPVVKYKTQEGVHLEYPTIDDVPVHFIGNSDFVITTPVKQGDHALIIFCKHSLDKWIAKGGIQDQGEALLFDISDCIAIVGFFHKRESIQGFDNSKVQIRQKNTGGFIEMDSSGQVNINGHFTVDL